MQTDAVILGLVFLLSACEAVGQSVAFVARQRESLALFLLAWVIYAGVVYILYTAYGSRGVGFVNALWSGMMTVLMLLVGRVLFKERLTTVQWTAIGFILTGMVILVLPQKQI